MEIYEIQGEGHVQGDEAPPSEKPTRVFKQLLNANRFTSFPGMKTTFIRKLAVTSRERTDREGTS